MKMSTPYHSTLLTGVLAAFLVGKLVSWHRRAKKLPPGPPKLPLIDNLHNMPPKIDWFKYAEFAHQYGEYTCFAFPVLRTHAMLLTESDIIHMSALGNSVIVLHTFEAAQDLLEHKSAIYSSRPWSTMGNELSHFDDLIVFTPYNNRWKASRRLFNKHFGGGNDLHRPRETYYVRRFLSQLMDTPEDFRQHIRHGIGSISISMTYGLNTHLSHDPYIDLAERAVSDAVEIFLEVWVVDVFPALKYLPSWLPGMSFKRAAKSITDLIGHVRETLFNDSRLRLEDSSQTPSFVSKGLQDLEESNNVEEDTKLLKDVTAQVYFAAADTTTSAVSTFFLAMVCYPDVQRKLQQELDTAIQGRLPFHDDISSLPYLTAVIMETFRWKVTLPVGTPHCTTEDDVYKGYFIPKGSLVVANQWAMTNDPRVYPEPSEFQPERFLKNGKINESVRNPIDIAFGFGRRKCPGRHMAQSTLTLIAASVLSVFSLEKKLDQDGNFIEPTREYENTGIDHPKPFPCEIRPRNAHAKALVAAWVSTDGENPP